MGTAFFPFSHGYNQVRQVFDARHCAVSTLQLLTGDLFAQLNC
jgi:hypothetical protein